VRIRVEAVAFNPVDCQIRKGSPGSRSNASLILGRDLSGVIEAVHESVREFAPGDEVYSYVTTRASSGTYAEYVCVPAELVAPKPRSLRHEEAAAVPVAAITASLALEKLRAGPGRSLFIAGAAGGVGSFAVMLARDLGVDRLGLRDEQVVSYRDAGFIERALELNGGPFDGTLDLVGGAMLTACCRLVALGGDMASAVDPPSADDFEHLFSRNASFHPIGAHAYSLAEDRAAWRRYGEMLRELSRRFDAGALPPPFVTRVGALSAEAVRRAHALLDASSVQGKLVMSGPWNAAS